MASRIDVAAAGHMIAETCRTADDNLMAGGHAWYPVGRTRSGSVAGDACLRFARMYGTTYRVAAAVVAICNLNNTWSGSLTQSDRIGAAFAAGQTECPRAGLPLSCRRSWAVLHGAPLTRENIGGRSGNKTWSFYRNLIGQTEHVTVDRWACRAAGVPDATHATDAGYAAVSDAYRLAADELGWTPCATQAVAWTTIRGRIA